MTVAPDFDHRHGAANIPGLMRAMLYTGHSLVHRHLDPELGPVLLPLIDQLGFNLTWVDILVAVNLQTAWLSPPVVLSAYFLKGVVPEWDSKDI